VACCLLANLFIGGIWRRTPGEIAGMGRGMSRSASVAQGLLGSRWRFWIVLLALSEIVLAIVLGVVLVGLLGGHTGAGAGHTGHTMSSPVAATTFLILALATTVVCGVVDARRASRRVVLTTVTVGLSIIVIAAMVPDAWHLHASWMALYMLAAVALPAFVGPYLRRTRTGAEISAAAVRISAPLLATAAALLMISAHLPVVHTWLMGDTAGRVVVSIAAFAVGVPFWIALLGDDRSELRTVRVGALIAFALPAGLLGLVLIAAPAPLWPAMVDVPWLPALWDQRISGLLMMGADLVFLVPLLASALGAAPRRAHTVGRTA